MRGKAFDPYQKENLLNSLVDLYSQNIRFSNIRWPFKDTLPLPLEVILPVIAAIASFTVAGIYTAWVAKQKPGTKEMLESQKL